jgi:hypothetical protein
MTTAWKPILLCAAGETKTFAHLEALGPLVAVNADPDSIRFFSTHAGKVDLSRPIPFAEIRTNALAFVAASPGSNTLYRQVEALWTTPATSPPPTLCYDSDRRGRNIATAVAQSLVARIGDLHQRNTRLMREQSLLRSQADQVQSAFEQVERYLNEDWKDLRKLVSSLPVIETQPPLSLRREPQVEQRLPTSSSGLSDISLSLFAAPVDPAGALHATLELRDSGESVARWAVNADQLHPGWLRLALPRALGHDPQGVQLRLSWQGEDTLLLSSSQHHPDFRFAPLPDTPMLALQCWKSFPGTQTILSADAILPEDTTAGSPSRRWTLGRSLLSRADGDPARVGYSDHYGGLRVEPRPGSMGIARVDEALQPGVSEVTGGIKIEHDTGPRVEFALAARPSPLRSATVSDPVGQVGTILSSWLALSPGVWSMHNLHLPAALVVPHDLYLLTRLPDGTDTAGPVPAYFYQLTAMNGDERDGSPSRQP